MQRMLLPFYFLLACAIAESTPTPSEKSDPAKVVEFLASPEVTAATKALEAIRNLVSTSKTSEVNLSERQNGIGFQSLKITAEASYTTYIAKEDMVDELTQFINGLDILPDLKQKGKDLLKKITRVIDHSSQNIKFYFQSPEKGGQLDIAFFMLGPVESTTYFRCSTFRASGSFKVMPDWYVKTSKSKKTGFFSSKESTTQEIVYVDRGVTQQDVAQLFLVAIPDMSVVQKLQITPGK